jgi:hypothetical protein
MPNQQNARTSITLVLIHESFSLEICFKYQLNTKVFVAFIFDTRKFMLTKVFKDSHV